MSEIASASFGDTTIRIHYDEGRGFRADRIRGNGLSGAGLTQAEIMQALADLAAFVDPERR